MLSLLALTRTLSLDAIYQLGVHEKVQLLQRPLQVQLIVIRAVRLIAGTLCRSFPQEYSDHRSTR